MTKYSHHKIKSQEHWRKQEINRKWQGIVGVFITVILLFAVFNGIAKTLAMGELLGQRSWDGEMPLLAAINTKPESVLIYRPEQKRFVLLKLNDQVYVPTSNVDKPIEKYSELTGDGDDLSGIAHVSRLIRSPVRYYINFEEPKAASKKTLEQIFSGFASLFAPMQIVVGKPAGVNDTNITQADMIRLWWQLKSLSINNLDLVDTSEYSQELVLADGVKVLGADDVTLHNLLSELVATHRFLETTEKISIEDASGSLDAANLARDFITSLGARVEKVGYLDHEVDKSLIVVQDNNSKIAGKLANIFECDINAVSTQSEDEVKLILGRDFARRYHF